MVPDCVEFTTGFFVTVPVVISVGAIIWIFRVVDVMSRRPYPPARPPRARTGTDDHGGAVLLAGWWRAT